MIFKTDGVCSQEIHIDVADGIINEIKFVNGCNGSLKAIAELSKGKKAEEIINVVQGITCGRRTTSCPDQLATALKSFVPDKID